MIIIAAVATILCGSLRAKIRLQRDSCTAFLFRISTADALIKASNFLLEQVLKNMPSYADS